MLQVFRIQPAMAAPEKPLDLQADAIEKNMVKAVISDLI
jgi:hypothetical protein